MSLKNVEVQMRITKQTPQWFRPSFTLVELLIAISIMGIMAGMVVFSLAGAQTDAKIVRTRSTIGKLNSVILQEWEKYRYRAARINVPPDWVRPVPITDTTSGITVGQPPLSPREAARLRLMVLRDTMRMEMPDRLTDILFPPTQYKVVLRTQNNPSNTSDDLPLYVPNRTVPGKLNNFRAKFGFAPFLNPYSVGGPPVANRTPLPPNTNPPNINTQNVSAEMLYQLVAAANYQGGSALEAFRSSEIGDTDVDPITGDSEPDGYSEFLDAWGNPIRWIRWPAGFLSALNDTATPDAMDPLRADWRHSRLAPYRSAFTPKPWLLVPLVVSGGPDNKVDLVFDVTPGTLQYATQTWSLPTDSLGHFVGGDYFFPDPYVGVYDPQGRYDNTRGLGAPFDDDGDGLNHVDNITNYGLILE